MCFVLVSSSKLWRFRAPITLFFQFFRFLFIIQNFYSIFKILNEFLLPITVKFQTFIFIAHQITNLISIFHDIHVFYRFRLIFSSGSNHFIQRFAWIFEIISINVFHVAVFFRINNFVFNCQENQLFSKF